METQEQKPIEPVETVEEFIGKQVKKLSYADKKIIEYKKFLKLKVNGIDDKEGLKKVHESRMIVRAERIKMENDRKTILENAVKLQKAVNTEANRIEKEFKDIEAFLLSEENKIEAEKERLRQEKIKAEELRVQNRIAALFGLGMTFNGFEYTLHHIKIETLEVKQMDDAQFEAYVSKAAEIKEKEEARIAEEKRLKEEAEAKTKAEEEERARVREEDRKREERRLDFIRKQQEEENRRLEALKKEQEERARKIKEENDAMEKAHAEKMKALREETERFTRLKLEAEKREKDNLFSLRMAQLIPIVPTNKINKVASNLAELQEEEFQTLLKTTQAAFDRINKEAAEKEERDREAKRQADERIRLREESLRPDKDKLIAFAKQIKGLDCPEVSSPEAQKVIKEAARMINSISAYIEDHAENL